MNIFIGCDDIASILSGLAEGFKEAGHTVTTAVFEKNKYYPEAEYDILLTPPLRKRINYSSEKIFKPLSIAIQKIDGELLHAYLYQKTSVWIEAFDIFIFIWRPWLNEEKILHKIKLAGKKVICVHVGSDVRHISAYKQEFNEDVDLWEQFFHEEDLNEKIKKLRYHEIYADLIYSVPDQAGLAIRPYHHIHIPVSNKKNFVFHIPGRIVPVIIHAPSRSGIKGTAHIIEAVNKLRDEGYQFHFEVIQNVTNKDLLAKLSNADILIDEVLLHGPGVLSIEAMLSGCAVATRTLQTHKDIFDPPVLNINPQNILKQVKLLLDNFNLRIQLAEKGKYFAQLHNNPKRIADQMLDALNKDHAQYTPRFYIENYVLPQGIYLSEKNRKMSYGLAVQYYNANSMELSRALQENLISK